MSEERGRKRSLDALEQDIRDTRCRLGETLDRLDRDNLLRPSFRLALRAARRGAAPGAGEESGPGLGFAAIAVAAALSGFAASLLRRRRPGGVPAAGEKTADPARRDAAE